MHPHKEQTNEHQGWLLCFVQEPGVYPGPLVELDFWTERAENLNSLHRQLTSDKIQKVVNFLENVKSTYHPAFKRLIDELELAQQEAGDNVKFLSPLRANFDKLNMMDDFPGLTDLFKPLMHVIMLIWKHSKYYNKAARVVTLMREICNDLIMQVRQTNCVHLPNPPPMPSVFHMLHCSVCCVSTV